MSDIFSFTEGNLPLLVSIPHDGRLLAPGMAERMTVNALSLPDTDWHVIRLYEFVSDLGASVVSANYSRYVVDLNRGISQESLYEGYTTSDVCPITTFGGGEIYKQGLVLTESERTDRIQTYWQPYHSKINLELNRLKAQYGYALLWDAHSILSKMPTLFDGTLPDFNLGTDDGRSCDPEIQEIVYQCAKRSGYSSILNGRFKGGFITRHFGEPENGVHSIQLELSQCTYMDEKSGEYQPELAELTAQAIAELIKSFLSAVCTNNP